MKDTKVRPLHVERPGIGIKELYASYKDSLKDAIRWLGWFALGMMIGACIFACLITA